MPELSTSPKPTGESLIDLGEDDDRPQESRQRLSLGNIEPPANLSSSPKMTTLMMRRSSTGPDGRMQATTVPVKGNLEELRPHLKHLGPSNRASNPRNTKVTSVKIKPVVLSGAAPASGVASGTAIVRPVSRAGSVQRPASIAGDHFDGPADADDEHARTSFGHVSILTRIHLLFGPVMSLGVCWRCSSWAQVTATTSCRSSGVGDADAALGTILDDR
jgi:hypothetical protein